MDHCKCSSQQGSFMLLLLLTLAKYRARGFVSCRWFPLQFPRVADRNYCHGDNLNDNNLQRRNLPLQVFPIFQVVIFHCLGRYYLSSTVLSTDQHQTCKCKYVFIRNLNRWVLKSSIAELAYGSSRKVSALNLHCNIYSYSIIT